MLRCTGHPVAQFWLNNLTYGTENLQYHQQRDDPGIPRSIKHFIGGIRHSKYLMDMHDRLTGLQKVSVESPKFTR